MKRAIRENKISTKRAIFMTGVLLTFGAGLLFFIVRSQVLLDELFCLSVLHVIFALIMVLAIVKRRLTGDMAEGQSNDYRRLFVYFLICWVLEIVFVFCPDYFIPVMLIPLLLSLAMDSALALSFGIYFTILLCVFEGLGNNALYCYCLLDILGIMLLPYVKDKKRLESMDTYILYFLINSLVPILFYYMTYLELSAHLFFYAIGNGIVTTAMLLIFYQPLSRGNKRAEEDKYARLMEDTYPLVADIRNYSMAEYNHAKRVSRLSAMCAQEIGADIMCCACAGFYYRLGKMEGEPEIDNALKLANDHCFPIDVMLIMEEYGGIIRLPQTPESAIVHMVDMLVTKIELLDQDTMSSTWNQDMVIYQSLNEWSQKGFYDESGMSINQFLRIREKLVAEETLL